MINTAFAAPDRTLTARITIDGTIYGPDVIASIKLNRGISLADQFEIGTAYAQVCTFELLDENDTLLQGHSFMGKTATVEIGVEILDEFNYVTVGTYILQAPEKVQKTLWRFDGADAMIQTDIKFEDNLEYPQTVTAIYQHAVEQAGLTTDTTTFINGDILIYLKPAYYDMTIREVLADVAELAAGYCLYEDGQIRIKSIVQDQNTIVNGENIISFRRHEDKDILIDQIIIQQNGAEDHVEGVGVSPYYIADNAFIQGDPERFAPSLYAALNGTAFTPCEVEFNGNPAEPLTGWVTLDFLGVTYNVLPMAREITFAGGMREKWVSNYLDNKPKDPAAENPIRTIRRTNASVLVLKDRIESRVAAVEEDMTELGSAFTQLPGQILQTVSQSYTTTGEFGDYKTELASQLSQTASDYSIEFTTVKKTVTDLEEDVQDELDLIKNQIKFGQEEISPGIWTPTITLGSSTNQMTLIIRNNKISFMQGTNEVAYISNNTLYITDGTFLNSLRIGNFAFKPRSNGSLSFSKVV
ncbi:hypothetical protein DSECCO2_309960 [anaerobic digester metagenome]